VASIAAAGVVEQARLPMVRYSRSKSRAGSEGHCDCVNDAVEQVTWRGAGMAVCQALVGVGRSSGGAAVRWRSNSWRVSVIDALHMSFSCRSSG
jgi:hypothetical protein